MLALVQATETAEGRLARMASDILARTSFNREQELAFELVIADGPHGSWPLTVSTARAAHALLVAWVRYELEVSGGEAETARVCDLVFALKQYVEANCKPECLKEDGLWLQP